MTPLLRLMIVLVWLLSAAGCVEPLPPRSTNSEAGVDMSDAGASDAPVDASRLDQDGPLDTTPASLSLCASEQLEDALRVPSYRRGIELPLRVLNASGEALSGPVDVSWSFDQSGTLRQDTLDPKRFVSGAASTGRMTATLEREGLEALITECYYVVEEFELFFTRPRLLRVPHTLAVDLNLALRVRQHPAGEEALSAWLERFTGAQADVELVEQSGVIFAPDAVLRVNTPTVKAYTLKAEIKTGDAGTMSYDFEQPVRVEFEHVSELATGLNHACARAPQLTEERALEPVRCWGRQQSGQLGLDRRNDALEPIEVGALSEAFFLSSRADHSCAIGAQREALCWGSNRSGGVDPESEEPVIFEPRLIKPPERAFALQSDEDAEAPVTWAQVSPGLSHTCALSTRGFVTCWGDEARGQLGYSSGWRAESSLSKDERLPPIELPSGREQTRFRKVESGYDHSCALSFEGELYCWGSNARYQIEGSLSLTEPILPTLIKPPSGQSVYLDLWLGPYNTCALASDEEVYCWGDNFWLHLIPRMQSRYILSPTPLHAIAPWNYALSELELGLTHSCAVGVKRADGGEKGNQGLFCWGTSETAALGRPIERLDASQANAPPEFARYTEKRPVEVFAEGVDLDVAVMDGATCILDRASGQRRCWGTRARGVLGDGESAIAPPPAVREDFQRVEGYAVLGTSSEALVVAPALTRLNSCLLTRAEDDDSLGASCWGGNLYGQSGTGDFTLAHAFNASRQSEGDFLPRANTLRAGPDQLCVIKSNDSKLRCWGKNTINDWIDYTILHPTFTERYLSLPVESDFKNASNQLDVSVYGVCAWGDESDPRCRGTQRYGLLGDGHELDRDIWANGDFILEDRLFNEDYGYMNGPEGSVVAIESGSLTRCMIRRQSDDSTPGSDLYSLWCWGQYESSFGLKHPLADSAESSPYMEYALLKVWEQSAARAPRGLGVGAQFGCLVDSDGRLLCWGSPPLQEQDSVPEGGSALRHYLPGHRFNALQVSELTACAQPLDEQGAPRAELVCFGDNTFGQLGQLDAEGSVTDSLVREVLDGQGDLIAIALPLSELYAFDVGANHVCVTGSFREGGDPTPEGALEVACWGLNTHGQADTTGRFVPGLIAEPGFGELIAPRP